MSIIPFVDDLKSGIGGTGKRISGDALRIHEFFYVNFDVSVFINGINCVVHTASFLIDLVSGIYHYPIK